MSDIQMMDDRILIDPVRNPELSQGGVYTGRPTTTFTQHEGADEQITQGKVIAVGPGKRHPRTGVRLPMDVEPGEYVVFSDTCHRPAGISDKDWVVIRGGDVALVSDKPFDRCEVVY